MKSPYKMLKDLSPITRSKFYTNRTGITEKHHHRVLRPKRFSKRPRSKIVLGRSRTPARPEWICKACRIREASLVSFYRHLATAAHTWISLRRNSATPPSIVGNVMIQLPEFLQWDENVNERCIVVTKLENVINSTRLLLHFEQFGQVTEFIADPEGQFAIIQYNQRLCVKNILDNYNSTKIDDGYVRVRCKHNVSFIEWVILLDLDGTYEKADQPFFILHCLRMYSLDGQLIHDQLHRFIEELSLTPAGIQTQSNIRKYLYQVFLPIFPNMIFCLLKPQVPDFSVGDDSSLEIFMDPLGETRRQCLKQAHLPLHHGSHYQAVIGKVRYVLSNLPRRESEMLPFVDKISEIPDEKFGSNAANPFDAISFTHRESGMKCKINFDDPVGPFVSSLIELMLQIEPLVLPVLKFVHYWARVHRFTNIQPNINLILSMMVFVYFMKSNVLPSVKVLQKLAKYSFNEEKMSFTSHHSKPPWSIELCTHLPPILDYLEKKGQKNCYKKSYPKDKDSTKRVNIAREIFTHLKNFFGAFSWLDFSTCVISPRIGDVVSRRSLLIKSSPLYHPKNERFQDSPLIVQHPFDLGRNLAVNCDTTFVNRMQLEFRDTHKRIYSELENPKPKMSQLFPSFHTLLRWEPPSSSFDSRQQKRSESKSSSSSSSSSTLHDDDNNSLLASSESDREDMNRPRNQTL